LTKARNELSARTVPASLTRLRLPARWALDTVTIFFAVAPLRFLGFAAGEVVQRLVKMASLLIPIKLLFLIQAGDEGVTLPWVGEAVRIGQMELTLLVVPVGALVVTAHLINQWLSGKKDDLVVELRTAAQCEGLAAKNMKRLVTGFSKAFGDGLMVLTCFGLITFIMPWAGLVIALFLVAAALTTRLRIKRMEKNREDDDAINGQDLSAIIHRTGVISDGTQAVAQALMLPVLIYLVAGEILSGRIDPILAIAVLMLFRLLVGGAQGAFGAGSRFLQTLRGDPKSRRWLNHQRQGAS
jgi:hypothetical protein